MIPTTRSTALLSTVLVIVLSGLAIPARACGFDGVFDGSFGVPHPRSIEVAVAVRRAVEEGTLPPSALEPIVPGTAGLWRATGRLHALEHRLSAIAARPSFSVAPMAILFIDSGLWTRFVLAAGAYTSRVHASKAGPDEVAVVTDEAAIAGILDRRLSARTAFDRGLIIVDAPPSVQQRVRDLLIAAFELALPVEVNTGSVSGRTPWRNLGH